MLPQSADPELRLSEVQAQIDRLVLALHNWQRSQEHLQPIERRLPQLTEECGRILAQWAETSRRHTELVDQFEAQLDHWKTNEARLREDVSHEVQAIVAEGRRAAADWQPVDDEGDRASDRSRPIPRARPAAAPPAARPDEDDAIHHAREEIAALTRLQRVPRFRAEEGDDAPSVGARPEREQRWVLGWLVLPLIAVAAALVVFGFWQLNARLTEATMRAVNAEREAETASHAAAKAVDAMRQELQSSIAKVRQTTANAETIGAVLSASDLVRFPLVGRAPGAPVRALVLWSRSRGIIVTSAHVPPAPLGATYQLWLLTTEIAVSAGVFSPDSEGRVTWAIDHSPDVPRSVIGAEVTIEPAGGGTAPSGARFLARAPE